MTEEDGIKRTGSGLPIPGPERRERPDWAFTDNFLQEMESVPLFMNKLPEDADDNPMIQALQSLAYDGTPEEVSENFKNQGNDCFKQGKKFYKDAISYYSKGLDTGCKDIKLIETLYVNRAACNLHFGNYRMVLNDCSKALRLNPKNIKALFRSAKALFALEMYAEAIDCCEHALNLEPDNQAIKEEKIKIQTVMDRKEKQRLEKELREQRIQEKKVKIKAALEKRHIKTTITTTTKGVKPEEQQDNNSSHEMEWDEEKDELTVPTFFLYPQYNESDFIRAFHEQDTIGEQLAEIFYEPAPWDHEQQYKRESVHIYFETEDEEKEKGKIGLLKVGLNVKLLTVLSHSKHVLRDGIARFYVVPKEDSQWKKNWLATFDK
ncbi:hypothetical protein BGZ65_003883 [Modicella reniformis]|uniref:Cns1/TTC4 wheel domain-containing protein n=1 Tax=Modicella reniformis TaxID=1440133 RepID=A0A9P6STW8_9FUNG|nr:hypothetical protein BGZ65_003883 [Modicella reniformis]